MAKELIISREYEKQQLQDCYDSKESQLVIVYGRRRVGKSFLINQFFNDRFDFKLVGDYRLTKEEQLYNFYDELKRQSGKIIDTPKTWREAFFLLRDYLDEFKDDEKHIVFLMKCHGLIIRNLVLFRPLNIFGTALELQKITLCLLFVDLQLPGLLIILITIKADFLIVRIVVFILKHLIFMKQGNF